MVMGMKIKIKERGLKNVFSEFVDLDWGSYLENSGNRKE